MEQIHIPNIQEAIEFNMNSPVLAQNASDAQAGSTPAVTSSAANQGLSVNANANTGNNYGKVHEQIKKSHEDLLTKRFEFEEKIKSFDSFQIVDHSSSQDNRILQQLEQERLNNTKLSTDLARSLELNLKLQFDLEEMRNKAQQAVNDERKQTLVYAEKFKNTAHELELSKALRDETYLELQKAKERFQSENQIWNQARQSYESNFQEQKERIRQLEEQLQLVQDETLKINDSYNQEIQEKSSEIDKINQSLGELEVQSQKQSEIMKELSQIAEKKIVELKMALDKRTLENQDLQSQMQQAISHMNNLRQENAALKDYINKLSQLHNQHQNLVKASS